jgi:hypothetical protein
MPHEYMDIPGGIQKKFPGDGGALSGDHVPLQKGMDGVPCFNLKHFL